MLNIQENDYIWVRTKDKKYFDGIVEYPYIEENSIAITQQSDSVCMPFGTIVINVDDIECFRKKGDNEILYCEEMLLPKKILVTSQEMGASIIFEPDVMYSHTTQFSGYKHVKQYCDCKLFSNVEFQASGNEYTLDQEGNPQYLTEDDWYDARHYEFAIVDYQLKD